MVTPRQLQRVEQALAEPDTKCLDPEERQREGGPGSKPGLEEQPQTRATPQPLFPATQEVQARMVRPPGFEPGCLLALSRGRSEAWQASAGELTPPFPS